MRLIFSIVFAAISIILMSWGLSPAARLVHQQPLLPQQTGLPEVRSLHIDFPAAIRAGETDRVVLGIEAGNSTPATTSQNIYEGYDVLAEARLDLAGMTIRPINIVSEPLLPGQAVTFFWSIRPLETGRSTGTVWFYLRFIPKDGGPERRQAVSAQAIEIEAVTLVGLEAESARWLSLVSLFIASLLGFPFFMGALHWIWGKARAN